VKNAVELLDVPSRNNSLMKKKYNSHVEVLFLYTHVFLFQLCSRMRKFDIRTVLKIGEYNGTRNTLSMSNKFDVEKGTTPPPFHYSYTRTYQITLGREMSYVLTNPFIFSQCGVPLVMDLRKLADHSHLDQKKK
jgi:hypothetical protein